MATQPVPTQTVYDYLLQNYPAHVLDWVKGERWAYMPDVSLSDIKMDRRPGGRDAKKTEAIAKAVRKRNPMDPVVLVETTDGFKVADGYHRTLAFRHEGLKTIGAWVAVGNHDNGPWDRAMHDAKLNVSMSATIRVDKPSRRFEPKTDLDRAYAKQYGEEYPEDWPDEEPEWTIRAKGPDGEIHRAQDGWGEIFFRVRPGGKPEFVATRAADVMLYHLSKPFKSYLEKNGVKKLGFGDSEWDKHMESFVGNLKGVSKTSKTMSVEQQLALQQGIIIALARAVVRMEASYSSAPNPGGDRRKGYPEKKSEYADPQDKAYPLNTEERVRNAAARFAQNKQRYSEQKRAEIEKRIDEAEKRLKIGKYREASSVTGAPIDFQRTAMEEVMGVLRETMLSADADDGTLDFARDLLSSEVNEKTLPEHMWSDDMIGDFMRTLRSNSWGQPGP